MFKGDGRQSFCLNFHTVLWPVNTGAAGVCDEKFSVGHLGDRNSHTHTHTHTHTHLAGSSGSWVLCLCVKELWKFNEEHQLMTCYLWPHFLSFFLSIFGIFSFRWIPRSLSLWLCGLYLDLSSSLNMWLHPVASLGLLGHLYSVSLFSPTSDIKYTFNWQFYLMCKNSSDKS